MRVQRTSPRGGPRIGRTALRLASAALAGVVCLGSPAGSPSAEAAAPGYVLVEAWPGLAIANPIGVACPRDDSDRVFVIDRGGRIYLTKKNRGGTPVPAPRLFLDITSLQMPAADIENGHGGLVNMAVPPDFATSKRFYVLYGTGTGQPANPYRTVLASYRLSASNPDAADPASGEILLTVPKPHPIHFGGGLCFGLDGTLYVAIGDTGEKGDPNRIAQRMDTLEGKILRLDVSAPQPGRPYSIPKDNPWPNAQGVRPEIFAYGVRHPFRMSIDRGSPSPGTLWIGDVGQKKREEIDIVPRAGNLGWGLMEGNERLDPNATPSKYVAPVFEYGRELGSCVIGGVVYRGQRCPLVAGNYVFADASEEGKLYALPLAGNAAAGAPQAIADVKGCSSIDEDAQGELYVTSLDDKKIFTLMPR